MRTETFNKPEYAIFFQNHENYMKHFATSETCKKKLARNIMTIDGFNAALEYIGSQLFPEIEDEYKKFALVVKRVLDYALD
jgi:hypothetical protein